VFVPERVPESALPERLDARPYPAAYAAGGVPEAPYLYAPEAGYLAAPASGLPPRLAPRTLAEVSYNDVAGLVTGISVAPVIVALALYGFGVPFVKRAARRFSRDVEMAAPRTSAGSSSSSPRGGRSASPRLIAAPPSFKTVTKQVNQSLLDYDDDYDDDDAEVVGANRSSFAEWSAEVDDMEGSRRRAAMELLKTAGYFAAWYGFNLANNIFNKRALTAVPLPWTAATVALGCGIPYVFFLWMSGLRAAPKLSAEHVKNLSGVCTAHLAAHVGGTIAIGAGAVSFVQIVKASEPVVACILSASLLGQVFSLPVYLSLLPIVGGVALSSFTELSFTWLAFGSAMMSNVAGAVRAILAKKQMGKPQGENMSDANLYAVLTIMSFMLLLPVSLMIEPPAKIMATWSAATAAGISSGYILFNLLSAGICYYLYNETAFLALGRVTPVTHAVANTVKRIVIILASMSLFGTRMTPLGMAGSGIAVAGAFLYALAKQFSAKPKKPQLREVMVTTPAPDRVRGRAIA
jgi:solute carrier family 35 protein E1